jgi:fatty acid desaturase
MIIIHGIYRWAQKRTAFRNDYCLSCEAPRKAMQIRTFNFYHLFWVPILPLGFIKRWFCMTCGSQPSYNKKTRYGFKIAGLIVLAIFAIFFWLCPVQPGDEGFFWSFRIGAPIGLFITIIHLFRSKRDPTYIDLFRKVSRAEDTLCPFCSVALVAMPQLLCPLCGVHRA